jgi:Ion channel
MTAPSPPLGSGILFDQILVGGGTSLLNLIIHAVLLGAVVWTVRRLEVKDTFVPAFAQYTIVIVSTGALLVAGHLLEVIIWAVTYHLVGAAPPDSDLIYFAFGNYTTLGYGDVTPVYGWRLLAPMTALNGIMLIGWSTALVIEVLRQTGHAPGRKLAQNPIDQ